MFPPGRFTASASTPAKSPSPPTASAFWRAGTAKCEFGMRRRVKNYNDSRLGAMKSVGRSLPKEGVRWAAINTLTRPASTTLKRARNCAFLAAASPAPQSRSSHLTDDIYLEIDISSKTIGPHSSSGMQTQVRRLGVFPAIESLFGTWPFPPTGGVRYLLALVLVFLRRFHSPVGCTEWEAAPQNQTRWTNRVELVPRRLGSLFRWPLGDFRGPFLWPNRRMESRDRKRSTTLRRVSVIGS